MLFETLGGFVETFRVPKEREEEEVRKKERGKRITEKGKKDWSIRS